MKHVNSTMEYTAQFAVMLKADYVSNAPVFEPLTLQTFESHDHVAYHHQQCTPKSRKSHMKWLPPKPDSFSESNMLSCVNQIYQTP